MANRVNTTTVGAFIVGAVVLTVAIVLAIGGSDFLHPRHQFICFFGGDLNGLKVGAPVKFRGVQVGAVSAIKLRIPKQPRITQTQARQAALPVFIEIDQSQISSLGGNGDVGSDQILAEFVARGLRAQLATESLLTGLLYIDLDFHEDTQPTFVLSRGSGYKEIPTVPTSFEQIQDKAMRALAKIDQLDFQSLIASFTDAARATRELVGSPELKEAILQLKDTAAAMKVAMARIGNTTDHLDEHMDLLAQNLKKTSDQATLTLASAQGTFDQINGTLQPDSPFGYQVNRTLVNLSEASQAIASLADYLQRNPSALVRGKATSLTKVP